LQLSGWLNGLVVPWFHYRDIGTWYESTVASMAHCCCQPAKSAEM
jgi:hypothetical protein